MITRLREIRKQRGVTQFELSKFINVHPQRISEVEHGKGDIKFKQAIKAAQFLNVSLDDLAGIQNQKPASAATERVGNA
jgi:transcriptional regulator with XRE-family HTH domain